ncbi:MAG TPA: prepilin peptidase, partial [Polyangiales bacterium]|nr:prepilin peptidase [Polyangiales bacterium]
MTGRDVMLLAALSFTALAAWCDLRTGHIPNRVTFGALAGGSLLQLLVLCWLERASGTVTLAFAAQVVARIAFGVVATALVPYLLFLRNGMGG